MSAFLCLNCFELKPLSLHFNCAKADLLSVLCNRLADMQSLTPPNASAIVHWDLHSRWPLSRPLNPNPLLFIAALLYPPCTAPQSSSSIFSCPSRRDRLIIWEESAAPPSHHPPPASSPHSLPQTVVSFCSAAAHLHRHGVIVAFLGRNSVRKAPGGRPFLRYW